MYLTVIVPCYNELENLERGVLEEMASFLAGQPFGSEMLISDDGSTDGSLRLAQEFAAGHPNVRVLANEHRGKPEALRAAVRAAQGDISLLTDMDQSAPLCEVLKMLPYFDQGYNVVIGSRGVERKNSPLVRRLASRAFRLLRKSLLLRDIEDTQCGFKAGRTQTLRLLFDRLQIFKEVQASVKGWRVTAYDVELLFVAEKHGERIKEVLVEWHNEDIARGKKKSFVRESGEMLREVLRVKWHDMRGAYGPTP